MTAAVQILSSLNRETLESLPSETIDSIYQACLPKSTRWIPVVPTEKQAAFLWLNHREAFYGGAAGGGKSEALLIAALQYVDVPDYAALILRRTYADLSKPNAIMDRAIKWLGWRSDVNWNDKKKRFTFPSGATLNFGYLAHEKDKLQYQGAEFQFIGFDELTHFSETQYSYLFSRLRRKDDMAKIPLRMRSASNPGGPGHQWVKQRFIIEGRLKNRPFIPAKLDDNPYLDRDEYIQSLNELDPTTRQQLLEGNWDAAIAGLFFRKDWFKVISRRDVPDLHELDLVRYWDLASTEPTPEYPDPDYTVGLLQGYHKATGRIYVLDMVRKRQTPKKVEETIRKTVARDGAPVKQRMEKEPGSSGETVIADYRTRVMPSISSRINFKGIKPTDDKQSRASQPANWAESGDYYVVEDVWTSDFLLEIAQFPMKEVHDDIVDCLSGGFHELVQTKPDRKPMQAAGLYERPQ